MSFIILSTQGKRGPFGSIKIARQEAKVWLASDRRILRVEIRPTCSCYGNRPYGAGHRGCFYEYRETFLPNL
jgi:hypothetical protein